MYGQFYGFREKPFSLLPDPDFLFPSRKHQMALDLLEMAIFNQSGFCVISGEIGTGKTTLIRELLNRLDEKVCVGLIANTHASFSELLRWILSAYNLKAESGDAIHQHRQFTDFIIDQYAQGKHTLLIIDEAQNLTLPAMEQLRMLSNVNSEKDLVLQVILMGQRELREKLQQPELAQFAQRISIDYHLTELDEKETTAYIKHRLTKAGGSAHLFNEAACALVYRYSEGVPRVINKICDLSLVYGFAEQAGVIDARLIEAVAQDQKLIKQIETPDKISTAVRQAESTERLSASSGTTPPQQKILLQTALEERHQTEINTNHTSTKESGVKRMNDSTTPKMHENAPKTDSIKPQAEEAKKKSLKITLDQLRLQTPEAISEEPAKALAEKILAKKIAAEKAAAAKAAIEKAGAELAAARTAVSEKLAAEKEAAEKIIADRKASKQAAASREAAEVALAERKAANQKVVEKEQQLKKVVEKVTSEKLAAEKLVADQIATEKSAIEEAEIAKTAAEKALADRIAAEKAANAIAASADAAVNKAVADRVAAEKLAAARLTAAEETAEQTKSEQQEAQRIAAEKAKVEQAAISQADMHTSLAEKAAAERASAKELELQKTDAAKQAAEIANATRTAAEKAVSEHMTADKTAAEKVTTEKVALAKVAANTAAAAKQAAKEAEAAKSAALKLAAEKEQEAQEAVRKADEASAAAQKAALEESESSVEVVDLPKPVNADKPAPLDNLLIAGSRADKEKEVIQARKKPVKTWAIMTIAAVAAGTAWLTAKRTDIDATAEPSVVANKSQPEASSMAAMEVEKVAKGSEKE